MGSRGSLVTEGGLRQSTGNNQVSLHAECKKHGGVPSLELDAESRNQAIAENFVKDILHQRGETAAESTVRRRVVAMLRDYEADECRFPLRTDPGIAGFSTKN
jgi:hypothetical protein